MVAPAAGEIRVLGGVEIVRDGGERVELPSKQRCLLAFLAAGEGKPCPPDALVDALWGDSPPPSAHKLIQVYVSKLRKALPSGARIRSGAGGYALEVDGGALDANRFQRLVADARRAAHDGNYSLVSSRLGHALSLWRGDAYGDLADAEFARTEARRLEELRVVALEARMEAELELGRAAELVPELRALAQAEPLREKLQALLMLALYRSGNQAEALNVFAQAREALVGELGLEPSPDLRDLHRRILRQDGSLTGGRRAPEAAAASLPAAPNALVGRKRELAELGELLRRNDVRLLVLTGAGGSGKTRLALEAARDAAPAFANGAAFVELASVQDPALLVPAIARSLGVDQVGSDPLDQLLGALSTRELLLVLDNLEHLRDGAAALAQLLAGAPNVTLLVTSRVVLHLSGEHVYPVAPLDVAAAVALFVQRALEADAAFSPAAAHEPAIAELCRRVDGLPLAIELAASHVRTLTPAELLAALDERLPLLAGGPRDLPARQRTLRATLEWSVNLLANAERRDLARLAVFPGRFDLASAESVAGTTYERIATLVDHNLLVRTVTAHGSRFSMLETVRELALERLAAEGEADATRRRHALRLIAVAEEAKISEDADEPFHWPAALAEPDDLRAALDWATENDVALALELASAWENYWAPHAPAEGVRRMRRLLDRHGAEAPTLLRARALRNLAGAAQQERDFEAAVPAYEEALRIFTELGDDRGAASVTMRLAFIANTRGEPALAERLLDDALRLAGGRFPMIEVQGAVLRGYRHLADGRLDEAEQALDRYDELRREFAWPWYDAFIRSTRMTIALRRGRLADAERHGRGALELQLAENYAATSMLGTVVGLGRIALLTGRLERAGLLLGAVLQHGEAKLGPESARWLADACTDTRPELVDALERGRALGVHDAALIAQADEPA